LDINRRVYTVEEEKGEEERTRRGDSTSPIEASLIIVVKIALIEPYFADELHRGSRFGIILLSVSKDGFRR